VGGLVGRAVVGDADGSRGDCVGLPVGERVVSGGRGDGVGTTAVGPVIHHQSTSALGLPLGAPEGVLAG